MNTVCCICLDKLDKTDKVIFKCNHCIHLNCYIESLKHDNIFCPLCRSIIKPNVNYYNYLNDKLLIIINNVKSIVFE